MKSLHSSLLNIHDKLPSGLIINRMTNDLSKVDNKLVDNFGIFMNLVSILTYLTVTFFAVHWSSIAFLAMFASFNVWTMNKFMNIRRVLIKNQSGSMTPVLDHLDDSLADLTSIRVSRLQASFFDKY